MACENGIKNTATKVKDSYQGITLNKHISLPHSRPPSNQISTYPLSLGIPRHTCIYTLIRRVEMATKEFRDSLMDL